MFTGFGEYKPDSFTGINRMGKLLNNKRPDFAILN